MKGKYILEVYNKKLKYVLELNRNITIIKGNSGTGKTTLCNMLRSSQNRRGGGVHCNIKDKIFILENSWKKEDVMHFINDNKGKIVVADEGTDYIYDKWFTDFIRYTDNYYVFISRSARFNDLTYAVNSIYYLGSEKEGNVTVNRLYKCYENEEKSITPDIIVVEDSKAGKTMVELCFPDIKVISSKGKDNVLNTIKFLQEKHPNKIIYTIVDGAAFGSCIGSVCNYLSEKVFLFAPESFEYLLLNAKVFYRTVKDKLINTENYCDSKDYLSWERYYTSLLINECKKRNIHYSKAILPKEFRNAKFINHMRFMYNDIYNSGIIEQNEL